MPTASELLARLRDPSDDAPSARLAAILVDDVLSTRVSQLVDADLAAAALRDSLRAWTASDDAVAQLVARVADVRAFLVRHERPVGELVPASLRDGLRTWVQLPFVVRREAVIRLLDRQSFKQLVRAQLTQTLADFGRRAASPVADTAIARGLGKIAGQIARPSPLGAIASAVSGEVERQVEKRASEFADTAVAGVLAGIAEQASDPTRGPQQAALRLELLEGLLALTGVDVGESALGGLPGQVAALRGALTAWVASDEFTRELQAPLAWIVAREGDRPLGDVLTDLAVREPVAEHARRVVRATLTRLTCNASFASWVEDLAK